MSPIQKTLFGENDDCPHRANASYTAYLESSPEALLLVSDHGAILKSNESFARLSLYSTVELADLNAIDLFHKIDEPIPLFPLHKSMLTQPLLSLTTLMRPKKEPRKPSTCLSARFILTVKI